MEWERLPEAIRASNRAQIDHVESQLREVGLRAQKVTGRAPRVYRLTPAQVDRLAELEHGRWVVERLAAGWRPGAQPPARRSPYLVAWRELPEEARGWNRDNARALPSRLVRHGYEIGPLEGGRSA